MVNKDLIERARKRAAIRRSIPRSEPDRIADILEELADELEASQAEIDRLMLEFCPDEMTPEQLEEWGKHQRKLTIE